MSVSVASFISEDNPLSLRFSMFSKRINKSEFKELRKANPSYYLEITAEGNLIIKPAKSRKAHARAKRQLLLKELDIINNSVEQIANESNTKYYFGRFLPNRAVMFVGEMPSVPRKDELWDCRDNFNLSPTDLKFIAFLNDCGLGGSYITDIVKICDKPRRPSRKEIAMFIDLLKNEINIVNPKLIVALGNSAYNILSRHLTEQLKSKLYKVIHPAGAQRQGKWKELKEQLENIKKIADGLK